MKMMERFLFFCGCMYMCASNIVLKYMYILFFIKNCVNFLALLHVQNDADSQLSNTTFKKQ